MTHLLRLRATIIFFCFVSLYLIIIGNLFVIQIWHQNFFMSLAEQQYHTTITQLPPRAPILDRSGNQYLALNKACMSAFIMPRDLKHKDILMPFLREHFPAAAERLARKPSSSFLYVKRHLDKDEQALIKNSSLADIHLLQESARYYPLKAACPILGFTDIDNHGIAGIEQSCNKALTGTPTTYTLNKDARSGYFYFKKELQEQGTESQPIQLTLNSDLQFLVDEELSQTIKSWNAQQGAVIVLDPMNGDILAMASQPYIHPSDTHTFSLEDTRHHAVTDAYELGSVIKIFAALAALEEKVVTIDEIIDCKNTLSTIIDGRRINTTKAHGALSFTDVLAYSNNIGIAQVAKRVGEKLYDHYIKLGFGSKTGIPIPGEHNGFVNHPKNWSKQSIISLSYGYEISGTLLQIASAFALIAHDGKPVKPRLLYDPNPLPEITPLYSLDSINAIKNIMKITTQRGTGRRTNISGYNVMTKTGTANRLVDGKYDSSQNIYTCAGIIEKDNYKRVIVTFVNQAHKPNAWASTIAVPLFERVAKQMIIHERMI